MITITKVRPLEVRPASLDGYILPFPETHGVKISQGYDGPFSHFVTKRNNNSPIFDDRFSLDFALPVGTLVLAARDGVVKTISDYSRDYYDGLKTERGFNSLPNFLGLHHEDDTYTLYAHLEKGIKLKMGEPIEQGQSIAKTGLSGWVGPIPHLHFAVLKYIPPLVRQTFPTTFIDYQGPLYHKELPKEN